MEWTHLICNDWPINFHTCAWLNNTLGLYSILWQGDYRVNGDEVCPQPYYLGIYSRTKISQKPSSTIAGPQVNIWNWSLQHKKHTCSTFNHGHLGSAKCFSFSCPRHLIPLILLMPPTLHPLHTAVVLLHSLFAQWLPNLWYQHSCKSGSHSYSNGISQFIHILQWNTNIAPELTLMYIAT
jgi:hypothetical protein